MLLISWKGEKSQTFLVPMYDERKKREIRVASYFYYKKTLIPKGKQLKTGYQLFLVHTNNALASIPVGTALNLGDLKKHADNLLLEMSADLDLY